VLSLSFQEKSAVTQRNVMPDQLVIAGWTGRDQAAVEKHIVELELLGVKRPSRTPIFYTASVSRLTTASAIEVLGEQTSGEAEYLLLQHNNVLWVGAGSDHTDRELEAYGVAASKQICDKPLAAQFWRYDDVAAHWDELKLRSFATTGGQKQIYQDGSVAQMLPPMELIARYTNGGDRLPENTLMFCGTLPVHGGIRPAESFAYELEDPVLGRSLRASYATKALPVFS
jgi:hypothetical protein